MKRRRNIYLWGGFGVILTAFLSYLPVFVRFPSTRDFPWASLLFFAAGAGLLTFGLVRAFREPQLYRGKVSGVILSVLSMALLGLFGFGLFYFARKLPASTGAPRVGQKAPDFTLSDKDGNPVTLSKLLATPSSSGPAGAADTRKSNGVVLIFYRGYW